MLQQVQTQWTLKRGIDKAVEAIVSDLAKQTKEVGDSSEKIKQVATVFLLIMILLNW